MQDGVVYALFNQSSRSARRPRVRSAELVDGYGIDSTAAGTASDSAAC